MALRLTSRFPANIVIDGELVPISIKRLDPEESVEFVRDFNRFGRRSQTPPLPDTATQGEKDQRVLEDEAIERDAKMFVVQSMTKFVTVKPGHLYIDDEEVTTGAQMARIFGARDWVLSELLQLIFMENTLSAEQKLTWRQRVAPFVPTPTKVAEHMMELAKVTDADQVYDLGCGNGQLCIAAAKRGAKAFGFDIDPERITEAKEAAQAAGVAHLCTFSQEDIMKVDVKQATVVTLYLLSAANIKLRPRLVEQLPAGARVVSHSFLMGGGWPFDVCEEVPQDSDEPVAHTGQRVLYLYTVDRWRKANA